MAPHCVRAGLGEVVLAPELASRQAWEGRAPEHVCAGGRDKGGRLERRWGSAWVRSLQQVEEAVAPGLGRHLARTDSKFYVQAPESALDGAGGSLWFA